jgi:hypothetical protein
MVDSHKSRAFLKIQNRRECFRGFSSIWRILEDKRKTTLKNLSGRNKARRVSNDLKQNKIHTARAEKKKWTPPKHFIGFFLLCKKKNEKKKEHHPS